MFCREKTGRDGDTGMGTKQNEKREMMEGVVNNLARVKGGDGIN